MENKTNMYKLSVSQCPQNNEKSMVRVAGSAKSFLRSLKTVIANL